jgi:lipase
VVGRCARRRPGGHRRRARRLASGLVGHSFGGRLVVELAVRYPERVRRAVLLDPAIQLPVELAESAAVGEEREPVWESASACFTSRDDTAGADKDRALADLELQLEPLADGHLRRRTSQEAVQAIYREVVSEPPGADLLSMRCCCCTRLKEA